MRHSHYQLDICMTYIFKTSCGQMKIKYFQSETTGLCELVYWDAHKETVWCLTEMLYYTAWSVGEVWRNRWTLMKLKNILLIHITIASSQNLRDFGGKNLALRYGLSTLTLCKSYEKTDSAPLKRWTGKQNMWENNVEAENVF